MLAHAERLRGSMLRNFLLAALSLVLVACGEPAATTAPAAATSAAGLEGRVQLDGSSTVFPISEAVAEEFGAVAPRVRVTVGISGTGGGFKKFIHEEIDISSSSRPIKSSEMEDAAAAGVEFI